MKIVKGPQHRDALSASIPTPRRSLRSDASYETSTRPPGPPSHLLHQNPWEPRLHSTRCISSTIITDYLLLYHRLLANKQCCRREDTYFYYYYRLLMCHRLVRHALTRSRKNTAQDSKIQNRRRDSRMCVLPPVRTYCASTTR